MKQFFDDHGTVLLLYSLVLAAAGATFYLGLEHPNNDVVFNWAAGFTTGAFSGLTVAMKVGGNGVSGPKSGGGATP